MRAYEVTLPTLLLWTVLISPTTSAGDVKCDGRTAPREASYTAFVRDHSEGSLGIRIGQRWHVLTESQHCVLSSVGDQLSLAISHVRAGRREPSLPSFVGVQVVRFYRSNRDHSDDIRLYRNSNWHQTLHGGPAMSKFEASILMPINEFLRLHRPSGSADGLMTQLGSWHASASASGPSSWNERTRLAASTPERLARFLPAPGEYTTQSSYYWLRFTPTAKPRSKKALALRIIRHGVEFMVIRIYSPIPQYNRVFNLEFK